jgi:hypothetical protein
MLPVKFVYRELTNVGLSQYQSHVDKYEHLDPAVSKRKRKALVTRLKEIIEELETKADQIYALYDVLESTGMGPRPWLGGEMSA